MLTRKTPFYSWSVSILMLRKSFSIQWTKLAQNDHFRTVFTRYLAIGFQISLYHLALNLPQVMRCKLQSRGIFRFWNICLVLRTVMLTDLAYSNVLMYSVMMTLNYFWWPASKRTLLILAVIYKYSTEVHENTVHQYERIQSTQLTSCFQAKLPTQQKVANYIFPSTTWRTTVIVGHFPRIHSYQEHNKSVNECDTKTKEYKSNQWDPK